MEDAEKTLGQSSGIRIGVLAYAFLLLLVAFIYVLFKPMLSNLIGFL